MGSDGQRDSVGDTGSGKDRLPEPRYLAVGRVLRPHGVRGELRVEIVTDYPERLKQHSHFYLAHADAPEIVQRYKVEGLRFHRVKILLLRLEGLGDRDAAEKLRGMLVQIPIEDAVPLEEGEYYHFQIIGVTVETEDGEVLGRVVELLETGANDVYIVHGPRGELLIPAIESIVQTIDLDTRRMVIRPLPGLLVEEKRDEG